MTAKSGQLAPDEDGLNTVEEFSGEELTFEPTFTQRIYDFLEKQKIDESTPTFYLYKYDDPKSGELKAFIQKYKDVEPPDEHDIGMSFGSGRYIMVMSIPRIGNRKTQMRAYRFRVHTRYDEMQQPEAGLQQPPAGNYPHYLPAPQQQNNSFNDAMMLMERVFSMLAPVLNRPRDENVTDILSQSYGAINDVMKRSMVDQFRTISDLSKQLIAGGKENMQIPFNDTETEPEEQTSIIEKFLPLIMDWLPKLIGGGPQAAIVKTAVQASPQFQQVIQDKQELHKIITYLDQARGPDETDKILAALNIKRIAARKRARKPAGSKA